MAPRSTTTSRSKPGKVKQVRVRMYRHGLGDCFLLTFQRQGDDFHMLIDCGVIVGTPNAEEQMKKVVSNIKEETRSERHPKGHLHLVVATHQHWDHLSGFIQAQDIFKDIKVDRVWLAWTEDPTNRLAQELRQERAKLHMAFSLALQQLAARQSSVRPLRDELVRYNQGIQDVMGFFGATANGGAFGATGGMLTQEALDWVSAKGEQVDYCYPCKLKDKDEGADEDKANATPLTIRGLDGVRFYVLGPPEDKTLIKKSDPTKKGKEVYDVAPALTLADSYFAAAFEGTEVRDFAEAEALSYPFESHYHVPLKDAPTHPFFAKHYGFSAGHDDWRRIDDEWLAAAGELALALDSDTNNTSLALAIELTESGKILLFPADAQVGNWLSWGDLTWTVKSEDGETRTITAEDLFARTVLYKVGHHGSHNATLRDRGLELMDNPDLIAMIPVNQDTAERKHWKMPFRSLLKRLREQTRGRVIIADEELPTRELTEKFNLSEADWKRFKKAVEPAKLGDSLFVDLKIEAAP